MPTNSGVSYPYTVANVLSITGSNQGGQYYYYFYDWVVEIAPTICISARVPVTVDVVTGINTLNTSNINLFPNPAKDKLFVGMNGKGYNNVFVSVLDMEGRVFTQHAFYNTNPSQNLELGLGDIAPGIYAVRVTADGVENVFKVVVK